jgi:GNAT superfamily N-acetyltransferase
MELWPEFEDLVGDMRDTGCWCMYWRIGADYRNRSPAVNREAFRELVGTESPPGVLALVGDKAVGWCQVTPRPAVPALNGMWRLRPGDNPADTGVWAITCLYVRKGYRRQGVTAELIREAIEQARTAGARVVEAYPFDAAVSPSASSTGFRSTFEKAGFVVIERRDPARPIMQIDLSRKQSSG